MNAAGISRRRARVVRAAVLLAACLAASARPLPAAQLPKSQLKDGADVLAAFREVVRRANRSTVAILADGRQVALGSVVGADGTVLTKASELGGHVRCRLRDGREFDATILGVHDRYDLALLKIECTELPAVEWTAARDPLVGQWLATPGMADVPVAVGIVSVSRRAVPPEKGILGVQLSAGNSGPRVTFVVPNSPAAQAGMQAGDQIVKVADKAIRDSGAFDALLRKFAPGDAVNVVVQREDRQLTLRAVLARPGTNFVSRVYWMNRMGGRLSQRRAGFPSAIQHDTVLEPEMCGGPVVDLSGRVVGVNIARAGRVETFAVPADTAEHIVKELRSSRAGAAPPPANPEKSRPPTSATPGAAGDAPFIPPSPAPAPARP